MQISVICVYNNIEQFQDQLRKTLSEQDAEYELIGIDNSDRHFTSAARALNHGAKKAKGDVLVFCHQDIFFKTGNELYKFAKCINKMPVGSIIGGAAAVELKKNNIGNCTSGKEYDPCLFKKYDRVRNVSSVDEVIFGMKKKTYDMHHFDEELCDGWHLYAVEQCLYHRRKGHSVVLCPIELHHFSWGRIDLHYMKNLLRISDCYKADFKYIWTTCYKIRSNYLYTRALFLLWAVHRWLKRDLR